MRMSNMISLHIGMEIHNGTRSDTSTSCLTPVRYQYWEISSNRENLPSNESWLVYVVGREEVLHC